MNNQLTIQDRVYSVEKEFNEVNSYRMNFTKEAQFALQLLQGNDYLQKAAQQNPAALEYAIINLASIGTTLNPALKEAYLVPRGGKICLDISYMGLIKLATDTGAVEWVQAEIVKEKDTFEYMGVGQKPLHKFQPFGDRGQMVGVYCVAKLSTGEFLSTIMSKADIELIKNKSSQAASNGPWISFFDEMAKKTVIKRAAKLWPKSERVQKAAEILNEHEGIDFKNEKAPKVDDSTIIPGEKYFSIIHKALIDNKKSEQGLCDYINTQFALGEDSKVLKVEQFNGPQIDYALRALKVEA